MSNEETDRNRHQHAGGFALILALLSLLVLTFLGLTLAATTSTELQIAANYRWGQQAFYNAEAGLEVAKDALRTADWLAILPPPRNTSFWDGASLPPTWTPGAVAGRNYENRGCDGQGNGMGYGVVYMNNVTTYGGFSLNGAFTAWVRRPLAIGAPPNDDKFTDYAADSDVLIITVEGVAPFTAVTATSLASQAVRVVEARLGRAQVTPCSVFGMPRSGQTGGGTAGMNFGSACTGLTDVTSGLGLASVPTDFGNQ